MLQGSAQGEPKLNQMEQLKKIAVTEDYSSSGSKEKARRLSYRAWLLQVEKKGFAPLS